MEAQTLLRAAGWFEGRDVDVEDELAFIRGEGFTASAASESFLREHSGLIISDDTTTNSDPVVLNGALAAYDTGCGWSERYSEAIGMVLSPVGVYSHMTVYVDPNGSLWGGYDADYGQIGSVLDLIHETFIGPPKPFDRTLRRLSPAEDESAPASGRS